MDYLDDSRGFLVQDLRSTAQTIISETQGLMPNRYLDAAIENFNELLNSFENRFLKEPSFQQDPDITPIIDGLQQMDEALSLQQLVLFFANVPVDDVPNAFNGALDGYNGYPRENTIRKENTKEPAEFLLYDLVHSCTEFYDSYRDDFGGFGKQFVDLMQQFSQRYELEAGFRAHPQVQKMADLIREGLEQEFTLEDLASEIAKKMSEADVTPADDMVRTIKKAPVTIKSPLTALFNQNSVLVQSPPRSTPSISQERGLIF
ncbi:MAG: hypothetical protein ACOYK8_01360 [Alphaproteobacteria bacterium]